MTLRRLREPLAALCMTLLLANVLAGATPHEGGVGAMCISGGTSYGTADENEGQNAGSCPFCTACVAILGGPTAVFATATGGVAPVTMVVAAAPERRVRVRPIGARAPPV